MRKPVTAIIPVRNGAKWIDSFTKYLALEINEKDEVIFVDDNSSDQSFFLLENLQLSTHNVKILRNQGTGLVSALNLAISHATNEWIARFDIDDSYVVGRLDTQLALEDSETALVFSDYTFLGEGVTNLGTLPSAIWDFPTRISLFSSQRTPHPIALIKREVAIKAGMYKEEDFPAEDLGLWLRIAQLSKITTVPVVLLKYNLRLGSVSSTNYKQIKNLTKEVIRKYSLDISEKLMTLGSLSTYLSSYSQYTLSSERKVLFILDLLKYCLFFKRNYFSLVKLFLFSLLILIQPKNFFALSRLLFQKYQRMRFRKLKFGQ